MDQRAEVKPPLRFSREDENLMTENARLRAKRIRVEPSLPSNEGSRSTLPMFWAVEHRFHGGASEQCRLRVPDAYRRWGDGHLTVPIPLLALR